MRLASANSSEGRDQIFLALSTEHAFDARLRYKPCQYDRAAREDSVTKESPLKREVF